MQNKKLIIVFITILSIISILLIFLMINLINGNYKLFRFNFLNKVSNELVIDEIYNNEFHKIDIKASSSDIYIKTSLNNTIRVVIYGNKNNTTVQTNDNILSINSKEKNCFGFCFNTTIAKIEVYLPVDFYNQIIINNNYGNIEIEKFLNANIKVYEDYGDVSILAGDEVLVDNDFGDIKVEQANKAIIKESAGDVNIGIVNDLTVENNYGDININEVRNYLNVSQDCGDIQINKIDIHKNSTISNDFGDIELGSTNEIYIEAKTDLGDIKINKNYPKSDINLKIENDCGDIIVNN